MTTTYPLLTAPDSLTSLGQRWAFDGDSAELDLSEFVVTGLTLSSADAAVNTAAIQAVADVAEDAGGGVVKLPLTLGSYVTGDLQLGTRVTLRGAGKGTTLILADGSSTDAAPVSMVVAKAATNWVGVEDLILRGNSAGQTDTNGASHGVDFTRDTTEGSGAPVYDGMLWCRNVHVYDCAGTGFKVDGDKTTVKITECESYHNAVDGFFLKTDCIVANCVAGNNTAIGFEVYAATSVLWANLKAFGGDDGFKVGYSKAVTLVGLTAEDVTFRGLVISSSTHVMGSGIAVYRCTGADSERSGVWIEDDGAGNLCEHVTLRSVTVDGSDFGTGFAYALWTRNLGAGIDVEMHTGEDILTGRWRRFSGAQDARVVFDNASGDACQQPAYAATYAPDPFLGGTIFVTLSGDMTIDPPAEAYIGMRMRFIFYQEGSFTVTFDATYKKTAAFTATTGAGAISMIEYVYDDASWLETSRSLALT
jgi:hypothetical protein